MQLSAKGMSNVLRVVTNGEPWSAHGDRNFNPGDDVACVGVGAPDTHCRRSPMLIEPSTLGVTLLMFFTHHVQISV